MLDELKKKAARFLLNRKYPQKKISATSFKNFFSRSSDFMIIMPNDDMDFHNSMMLILALTSKEKVVHVLVPEFKFNLLQNKTKLTITTYNLANANMVNLPNQSMINIVKRRSYDILIDLNRKENLFCSAIVNSVSADFKVGFCKLNSDKYYNFQVVTDEINSEISYRNLLNSLRMF